MKRDWNIIRAILLRLELASTPNTVLKANDLAPYAEQEVAYNIRLLSEAGYIKANIVESMSGDDHIAAAFAHSLTNSGHDLLDTIRSETVWGKIQDEFKASGLEMTADLVIKVGKKFMESLLG